LPFQGLEIQVLIIVILVASLYFLQKNEWNRWVLGRRNA
jgi:hypothetical protein